MHLSPTAGFQKQIADSGVANSIMGGGGNIHIFVFCIINFFEINCF
jgi:hypothetical protein